jgi:hypothetical protein
MSDSPPTSLGSALYGPNGPASTPQGPTTIEGGKAAPPQTFRGESVDKLPAAADPRSVVPNAPARPASTPVVKSESTGANPPAAGTSSPEGGPRSLGESLYPTTAPEAPTTPFTMPEGLEADPALMGEFGTAAKELRLDRAGADRLLALHAKATQAATDHQAGEWRKQSEAAFTAEELTDIRSSFHEAVGDDADAREFKQLLARTGIGNNPAVIRVIGRLVRR